MFSRADRIPISLLMPVGVTVTLSQAVLAEGYSLLEKPRIANIRAQFMALGSAAAGQPQKS